MIEIWQAFSDQLDDFDAVHARHVNVDDRQVELGVLQFLQADGASVASTTSNPCARRISAIVVRTKA